MSLAVALGAALPSFAADWTDANNATYTALKSINGGGNGTTAGGFIITDITPAGTETVKFKIKTPAAVSANGCVYCARSFTKSGSKWSVAATQFTGFRLAAKFRIDRRGTQKSLDDVTCTPNTEYSASADYTTGAVTINNAVQGQSLGTDSYTPGGKLAVLASYNNIAAPASPTASSTWGNYLADDLYYLQLWSVGGALEHNVMPASRDSDSAVGLYDTVPRTFHAAAKNTITGAAYGASERAGKKWTGLGGDNKMSTDANWENNDKPAAGDDVDFTVAAPNAAIVADIDATFGKIYLGAGDLPAFSGALASTAINDLTRMQAYDTAAEGFTFTLEAPSGQDFTWNGGAAANWSTTAASWLYNSAASVWYDNNNAIFNTAGVTATLTENITADSLAFSQPATIDGTATLTVPTVSVDPNVSATISAPTAGALEKTGAGMLTLGSSRTDATTVMEGTLKMLNGATVAGLTLGTSDPTKPVTFEYGGQTLAAMPETYLVTGSAVTLTNGTFTAGGKVCIRDSYNNVPSVLTVAKDATFEKSGASNSLIFDKDNGTMTVNVAGGAIVSEYAGYLQHAASTGSLYVNVTDGGLLSFDEIVYALCSGTYGTSPSLYMRIVDSTFRVGCTGNYDFKFGNNSVAPDEPTGVFAATNSTIYIGGSFIVGRQGDYGRSAGSYTVDFENCVVTGRSFSVNWDRPLNRARFNNTRYVFKVDGAAIGTCDDDAKWITVDAGGLVIDTQAYSATLSANLGGSGAVTKAGTGTLTVSRDQATTGGICVNEGTLAVTCATFTGPVAFAADTTLNIVNYDGHTPLSAGALELPAEGKVTLTLNGGAFPQGIYAICAAPGVTAADGGKFSVTTADGLSATWSVSDGTLLLTVGDISGNYWIGRAGDGKMSTAANWLNGVPAEGDAIDFSGVSSDVTIYADTERAFGTAKMGEGVVTFTGELKVKGFSNREKVVVGEGSTVTIDDDVTPVDQNRLCKTIQTGGTLHITGSVKITSSTIFYVLRNAASAGAIIVDGGIVVSGNGIVWWSSKVLALGENGISFTDNAPFLFIVNAAEVYALGERTVLGTQGRGNFRCKSDNGDVYLCTTQYGSNRPATITFDGNFNGVSRSDSGSAVNSACWGHWRVTGCGKVVCTSAAMSNRGLLVYDGATLAFNPNTNTFGATDQTFYVYNENSGTVGGTLEVASSGTVTLTGNLSLADGAALGFNFTDRNTPPQLALSSGKTMTVSGAVKVKIPEGSLRPTGGEHVLTTCGGFDAEGVTVSLAAGAPDWVRGLSVNADGNLVLDVKPKGTMIIVR